MEMDISEIYLSKNLKECKELIKRYKKFLENYKLNIGGNQMTFIISKEIETDNYIKIIPKEGEIKSIEKSKIKNKKLEEIAKSEFIACKNDFRARIDGQEFRVFYASHKLYD